MITEEQKKEIVDLLKGFNVTQLCKELHNKGLIPSKRRSTIREVLEGKSKMYDTLYAVVEEAKKRKAKLEKKLKSL